MAGNAAPAPGELFAEKYRIQRVLGEGGMGVVVEAHHLHLDEKVAIKFLRAEVSGQANVVERFMREARATTKAKNEHIARTLDVGVHDGTLYMVMEYLEGETLKSRLERGPLTMTMAAHFLLEACEAVAAAHAAGIVHRDLKPENLFLCARDDGRAFLKVLDFGISKSDHATQAITTDTALMGSPLYMSPEQMLEPTTVDRRTDIWALGVILFECVTGKHPFEADTLPQLCVRVRDAPVPDIRTLRSDLPAELDAIIKKCLEKDRRNRFESVNALAGALREIASETAFLVRAPNQSGPYAAFVEGPSGALPVPARQSQPSLPDVHDSSSLPGPVAVAPKSGDSRVTMLVVGLLALAVLGGVLTAIAMVARRADHHAISASSVGLVVPPSASIASSSSVLPVITSLTASADVGASAGPPPTPATPPKTGTAKPALARPSARPVTTSSARPGGPAVPDDR